MIWSDKLPKPSQIIRTKVSFYYHYGIFISDDEIIQFGLPNAPSNLSENIRVLATDIITFLGGGELETAIPAREEKKRMRSPKEIIKIARSRIGEGGYDILHNNCEHFVNSCVFGTNTSSFVESVRSEIRKKLKK